MKTIVCDPNGLGIMELFMKELGQMAEYVVTFYSYIHPWGYSIPGIWGRDYEDAEEKAARKYPYKYNRAEVCRV